MFDDGHCEKIHEGIHPKSGLNPNKPLTGQKRAKKDPISMSNRNKSIEAQTIAKAMISHGYDPEDGKTRTVADFWMAWIDTQAGPEEANTPPYRAQTSTAERGGGLGPVAGTYQLMEIEDKGTYVRAQVQTEEGKKWASAWDKDAGALRSCRPGERVMLDLNPSKCGKYLNIKNVVKPVVAEEIPF
jgi:hypothetical protein